MFLIAELVHAHHVIPRSMGGNDSFVNLRIIHKAYHMLIHSKEAETINRLLGSLQPGEKGEELSSKPLPIGIKSIRFNSL